MNPIITITRIRPDISYSPTTGSLIVTPTEKPFVLVSRAGVPGPPGPPGAGGSGAGQFTKFSFASAAEMWNLPHNYGREATVSVYTTGGLQVIAQVLHLSLNIAQVFFDEPMSGYAIVQ